jgi:hypothetical protein
VDAAAVAAATAAAAAPAGRASTPKAQSSLQAKPDRSGRYFIIIIRYLAASQASFPIL